MKEPFDRKSFTKTIEEQVKTLNQILVERQDTLRKFKTFSREEAVASAKSLDQKWVPLDVVLGVYAKTEAENEKIRLALAQTCTELNDKLGRLERVEADRNQKLTEWFKNFLADLDLENICQYDDDDLKEWKDMQMDFFKQKFHVLSGGSSAEESPSEALLGTKSSTPKTETPKP